VRAQKRSENFRENAGYWRALCIASLEILLGTLGSKRVLRCCFCAQKRSVVRPAAPTNWLPPTRRRATCACVSLAPRPRVERCALAPQWRWT